MAWIYSLSAEVGERPEAAAAFASHFKDFTALLLDGSQYPCGADTHKDFAGGWWVCVCPDNVNRSGGVPGDLKNQLALLLYNRLREAPPFRYALIGTEVDDFRT